MILTIPIWELACHRVQSPTPVCPQFRRSRSRKARSSCSLGQRAAKTVVITSRLRWQNRPRTRVSLSFLARGRQFLTVNHVVKCRQRLGRLVAKNNSGFSPLFCLVLLFGNVSVQRQDRIALR